MSPHCALIRTLSISVAWSLCAAMARAQASSLRERAVGAERGNAFAVLSRRPTFQLTEAALDTVENTCRGKYLISRLIGTTVGGALSGWLIYGLTQIAALGGADPALRGRLVAGGAVVGAGVVVTDVAFNITCHDVLNRR